MRRFELREFTGGWVIGNFAPSITRSQDFEFGVKYFAKGDREPQHFQAVAQEVTVVVSGRVRVGGLMLSAGDICQIPPGESADFEALENCALAVVKFPSIPDDKFVL